MLILMVLLMKLNFWSDYPAPELPPPPPPPPPPENPPPLEVELLKAPEVAVIEWIVLERLLERLENCCGEIVPFITPLVL